MEKEEEEEEGDKKKKKMLEKKKKKKVLESSFFSFILLLLLFHLLPKMSSSSSSIKFFSPSSSTSSTSSSSRAAKRRSFSLTSESAPRTSLGFVPPHRSASFSNFFVVARTGSTTGTPGFNDHEHEEEVEEAILAALTAAAEADKGNPTGTNVISTNTNLSSQNEVAAVAVASSVSASASASVAARGAAARPQQLFPWTLQSLSLPIPFTRALYSIPPEVVESFWVQYLTSTPLVKNRLPRDTRMSRLVALGVPAQFRAAIWSQLALDLVPQDLQNQAHYHEYVTEAQTPTSPSAIAAVKSIEGDLDRTFPERPDFRDLDCIQLQRMRRILTAYSVRNPASAPSIFPFLSLSFSFFFLSWLELAFVRVFVFDFRFSSSFLLSSSLSGCGVLPGDEFHCRIFATGGV